MRDKRGKLIIAIDGPAGAGKSTVAKRLAKELSYIYMDTGAMYRAVALKASKGGMALPEEALQEQLKSTNIELVQRDGQPRVILDGIDVTDRIRTPELSQMASRISTFRTVRSRMVELQRAMAREGGVVAEGRDIGTVVFPKADVKIYLDALAAERARRRFEELKGQEKKVDLAETLKEMDERDRRDKEREVAPLRKAEDAIFIDTSQLSVDQVVGQIMKIIKDKEAEIQ